MNAAEFIRWVAAGQPGHEYAKKAKFAVSITDALVLLLV